MVVGTLKQTRKATNNAETPGAKQSKVTESPEEIQPLAEEVVANPLDELLNNAKKAYATYMEAEQQLSKAYKENWPRYIVVDPSEKISAMYDRARKKEFIKNYVYKIPEGYDEFKM